MTQSTNPYLLPPRKPVLSGHSGYEPKAFAGWIEDLPVGNVSQTARLLHDRLFEVNRLDIPPVDRIKDLGMLEKPIDFVLQSLGKALSQESFPLTAKGNLIANIVSRLLVSMIQAYKVALDQFHYDSISGRVLHKGSRAEALHRVLYYFGYTLLNAYQLYRVPPQSTWREIHGIYHYAVESKLQDKLLANGGNEMVERSTATDLYKRILLLSLMGPFRLKPGEIQKIYRNLLRWVARVRLINLANAAPEDGLFLVDITTDNSPRYRQIIGNELIKIGWVLDTAGLQGELEAEMNAARALDGQGDTRTLNHPVDLSADLIVQLMLCWGVGPQRSDQEKRHPEGGQITLACGLENLYRLAGGHDYPELSESYYRARAQERESERSVSHEPIARSRLAADEYLVDDEGDLQEFIAVDQSNHASELEQAPQTQIINEAEDVEGSDIRRCAVFNRSSRGYHLALSGSGDSRFHIGELVGVKRDDGDGVFQVGVIRWLRSNSVHSMEFGVELFSGEMQPVVIARQGGMDGKVDHWRGFINRTDQETQTLLMPMVYIGAGDTISIKRERSEEVIQLNRAVESSASFIQYSYTSTVAEPEPAETVMEDFEEIWNEIK